MRKVVREEISTAMMEVCNIKSSLVNIIGVVVLDE